MTNLRFQARRARAWIDIWTADLVNIICQAEMLTSFSSTELEQMLNALNAEYQLREKKDDDANTQG